MATTATADRARRATRATDGTSSGVEPRGSGSWSDRVTFSLSPQAAEALEKLVSRTHASKTDAINRALHVFEYLESLQHTDGGALYVRESRDEEVEKLRFL